MSLWYVEANAARQNVEWVEPLDNSPEAKVAAAKSLDIIVGWVSDHLLLMRANSHVLTLLGNTLLSLPIPSVSNGSDHALLPAS